MLSGYSEPVAWNKLAVAPLWLKDRFLYLIRRETEHALAGAGGRIIAKMNSVCDSDIIKALYRASMAGVRIDLIVRGICSVRAGVENISDNITVRSIVGTYLEHARIFYFYNSGNEELYCGSADWMPRNLERRVEILFPVENEELKEELKQILQIQLDDNVKASVLQPDGDYLKVRRRSGQESVLAQGIFCDMALNESKKRAEVYNDRVFIPETNSSEE